VYQENHLLVPLALVSLHLALALSLVAHLLLVPLSLLVVLLAVHRSRHLVPLLALRNLLLPPHHPALSLLVVPALAVQRVRLHRHPAHQNHQARLAVPLRNRLLALPAALKVHRLLVSLKHLLLVPHRLQNLVVVVQVQAVPASLVVVVPVPALSLLVVLPVPVQNPVPHRLHLALNRLAPHL
jgi:hypothetical protein